MQRGRTIRATLVRDSVSCSEIAARAPAACREACSEPPTSNDTNGLVPPSLTTSR